MALILGGEFILAVLNAYLAIQAYSTDKVDWITGINVFFVILFTMSLTARVTAKLES